MGRRIDQDSFDANRFDLSALSEAADSHLDRSAVSHQFFPLSRLFSAALNCPPAIDDGFSHVSLEARKCLQVLGRIRKGDEDEIASLTGLSKNVTLMSYMD
jgi:hypothetical protein